MVGPTIEAAGAVRPDVEREERGFEPTTCIRPAIESRLCLDEGPAAIGDGSEELVGDQYDECADGESDDDFNEGEPTAIPALKGGLGLCVRP